MKKEKTTWFHVFIVSFRRLHNLDVDVAVSGFTKEQKDDFEEVFSHF